VLWSGSELDSQRRVSSSSLRCTLLRRLDEVDTGPVIKSRLRWMKVSKT
jgi:hypothetical protein